MMRRDRGGEIVEHSIDRRLLVLGLFVRKAGAELVVEAVPDGKPHKLNLHDKQFWIDDQPLQVVAGEMHLSRILPELWEDRVKKARALRTVGRPC